MSITFSHILETHVPYSIFTFVRAHSHMTKVRELSLEYHLFHLLM